MEAMTQRSWWGAELLGRHADDMVWARAADREVTFGRLRRETAWLAGVLEQYGIRPRSTVALYGNASFTHLWTLFALWSLGAQVVLGETPAGRRSREVPPGPRRVQFSVSLGENRRPPHDFVDECEVLVRRHAGGGPSVSGHCLVQFSSGTTGRPKAVGRSPRSLLEELDRLAAVEGVPRHGERVAVLEPLTHSFGLIGGLLHSLAVGATVVVPVARTAEAAVRAAADAHVVLGNPHHFRRLARAEPGELPRLRLAVSSGDALPPEIPAVFRGRHGVRVGQAYGTTETGIIAADLTGRFGPAGVGVPVPGIRTRVVGGVLEVHVPESPYLYDDTPWTGGWMSTRDLVTRDPRTGALRLRGRVQASGTPRSTCCASSRCCGPTGTSRTRWSSGSGRSRRTSRAARNWTATNCAPGAAGSSAARRRRTATTCCGSCPAPPTARPCGTAVSCAVTGRIPPGRAAASPGDRRGRPGAPAGNAVADASPGARGPRRGHTGGAPRAGGDGASGVRRAVAPHGARIPPGARVPPGPFAAGLRDHPPAVGPRPADPFRRQRRRPPKRHEERPPERVEGTEHDGDDDRRNAVHL
nr:AhbL2 [Streptomyces argillaceus]